MKKTSKGNWLTWLILLVVGVLLIIGKDLVKDALYIVAAIGLILASVAGAISWLREKPHRVGDVPGLLGYIVTLVAGAWILANPGTFDRLLNVLIGLILIGSGIQWFFQARKFGGDCMITVISVTTVILGLIIACYNAATSWPIVVEGIALIYTAVAGWLSERRLIRM